MKRAQQKNRDQLTKQKGETSVDGDSAVSGKSDESSTQKRFVNWKLVDRLAKLFVVGLILVLCWNVLQSMFFVPASRVERRAALESGEAVDEASQRLAEFTAGSWSFGDGDWQLQVYPESKDRGLLAIPDFQRSANSSFDDQEFIDRLKTLGARPKVLEDGWQVWQSQNSQGFSIILFTRDSVVQVLRTRFPSATGFSIVEGRPKTVAAESDSHLLPIENGIRQVATRVDVNNRMTSAIWEIDSEYGGDIRVVWRENGWDVQPVPDLAGAAAGMSAQRYRCTKDGQSVEATFFLDKSTSRPSQIILNRFSGSTH